MSASIRPPMSMKTGERRELEMFTPRRKPLRVPSASVTSGTPKARCRPVASSSSFFTVAELGVPGRAAHHSSSWYPRGVVTLNSRDS